MVESKLPLATRRNPAMVEETVKYAVVLVAAASQTEAEAIAQSLLEAKLAACVSVLPIQSMYRWQGKLEHQQEWQLLIKTRMDLFTQITVHIQAIHSYQVPEVIALPVLAGALPYLSWISEQLA